MKYYVEQNGKMFTYASKKEIPIVNVYGPFDSVVAACDKISELGVFETDMNQESYIIKCYIKE